MLKIVYQIFNRDRDGTSLETHLHGSAFRSQTWLLTSRLYSIRASVAAFLNVLNAIIISIWHTKHKKQNFIRCVKCVKLLQHFTVPLQFWHGMDKNGKCLYYFLIHFLSPPITYLSLRLQHISFSLCLVLSSPFLPTLYFVLTLFSVSIYLSQIGVEGVEQWRSIWMGRGFDIWFWGSGSWVGNNDICVLLAVCRGWDLLAVGLGFDVVGMDLLNWCLKLGFEWVVGCGAWLWWSVIAGCLGGFKCWCGGFWVLFWWLFRCFRLVDVWGNGSLGVGLDRCLAKSMGVVGWFNFGDWLVVVVPEL